MELPLFDMSAIEIATNNFSDGHKLGEGGFGPVYKGHLGDGQEIAVKRLSRYSVQGLDEFMNEVMLIAKLQHRNLVRLIGCCIKGEERLLIYEYMPNKSLDSFIFDKACSCQLDWQKRFDIIIGIARGLLYLHQDSRLKIVHRDLKVSNVLLDKELNPKISDFGMARIVRGDQMQESTEKVVGTYGYMSPEYAMHGIFSIKSDVFSFGVIVLEILTGKKNRVFDPNDNHVSLVGHAWRLWSESKSLELVDDALKYGYPEKEVLRCMQISLLCVQEGSEDRPTMASVVLMLGSEGMTLPQPKRPGFYPKDGSKVANLSTSDHVYSSGNDITVTMIHGR
ncbi:G-type lectin S-receptor-like serine/threonine-protein kinase SD1-1 isoform X2 [Dendrobium catenatum]|nr:G-type lectin S-receptor-like serine/threonine-protein kinase SD1-1 isoform X2 [Dendrobium catenatum]